MEEGSTEVTRDLIRWMLLVGKTSNSRASVTSSMATDGKIPKAMFHADGWEKPKEGLTPAGDQEETESNGFAVH